MKTTMIGVVLTAGVLSLAACGETTDTGSTPKVAQTTTRADTQQALAARCARGGKALSDALRSSLQRDVGLERISIAEVEDASDAPLAGFRRGAYAVAGRFTGPGMDGTIGVWAASSDMVKTGGGLVIGADSVTREFSAFGAAAEVGSPAADYAGSVASSEAGRRAVRCAEG